MARWGQFEVWVLAGEKWELAAWFHDFDVASEVARSRGTRVRLIHAEYEDGSRLRSEVLAELGSTREHP